MNQDRVKELLSRVAESPAPFSLSFSGKSNDKVNGLYKPDKAEIVIHNKNFSSDDELIYTALHEYAHHLHHCRRGGVSNARPHTQEFWAIFNDLVVKAQDLGFYRNLFENLPEFVTLTAEIKKNCITANGEIMLELGRLLAEAADLCKTHHVRFEDYIERVLGVPRSTAATAVAARTIGLTPALGWDGLRYAASIKDPDQRQRAVEALASGASPATVKGGFRAESESDDPSDRLLKEKARIERTIENLSERLKEIEERLSSL